MSKPIRRVTALVLAGMVLISFSAHADDSGDTLTGDKKTACEALLCLSSGDPPSECNPALKKYFSIKKKKASNTRKARKNFLELCPAADDSPEMRHLVQVLTDGAGRCDAASLNLALRRTRVGGAMTDSDARPKWEIADKLPGYCSAYAQHAYTDLGQALPRYVGTPKEGGYWVAAANYDRELAKYEVELARKKEEARKEEEQRRRTQSYGGDS